MYVFFCCLSRSSDDHRIDASRGLRCRSESDSDRHYYVHKRQCDPRAIGLRQQSIAIRCWHGRVLSPLATMTRPNAFRAPDIRQE